MNTLAYLLLLVALLLVRGVAKGRGITDLPGDLHDGFVAFVSGDVAGVQAVFGRTGDSNDVPSAAAVSYAENGSGDLSAVGSGGGNTVLGRMKVLGAAASGYGWGATGPTKYDCSGLVWRACKDTGVYTGVRFTTSTFRALMRGKVSKVTTPAVGDVVLWRSHIGVVDGNGTFYGAQSKRSGIKTLRISAISNGTPTYWRFTTDATRGNASSAPHGAVAASELD